MGKRIVTANVVQNFIAPALGAEEHTRVLRNLESIPQGQNAPIQQDVLRFPGVVEDSFGQFHIRGEHANATYRINGILLPQAIAVFGQEVIAASLNLYRSSMARCRPSSACTLRESLILRPSPRHAESQRAVALRREL